MLFLFLLYFSEVGLNIEGLTKINFMIGKIFKFKKTGNFYKIINIAEMKDPTSRDWLNSVIYTPYMSADKLVTYEEGKSPIYVRELKEFLNKFEEVNND